MTIILDELDRRIIGVLQVDGRASFKSVAQILHLPERTVSRRGQELLADGTIQITGLTENDALVKKETIVVRVECAPGTNRLVATALSALKESIFVYLTSGSNICITELFSSRRRLTDLTLNLVPGIPGVLGVTSYQCLKYHRTAAQWNPGILSPSERSQLMDTRPVVSHDHIELDREDKIILETLALNGRASFDQLARTCGLSEATARRRTTKLIEAGALSIHAVVEPSDIGFPIESWIWIQTSPENVSNTIENLLSDNRIRYLAAISGEYQLLAQIALGTNSELNDFLYEKQNWSNQVTKIESLLMMEAFKRSGLQVLRKN